MRKTLSILCALFSLVLIPLSIQISLAQKTIEELEPITAYNMDRLTVLHEITIENKGIANVLFSPNDDYVALLTGRVPEIQLWRVDTGEHYLTLNGHEDVVLDGAFSPDGSLLASASGDKTVRIWDTKSGEEEAVFDGYEAEVENVVFSPDGNSLASLQAYGAIRVWDVNSRTSVADMKVSTGVTDLIFSPDGKWLAGLDVDGVISLWNTQDYEQVTTYQADDYDGPHASVEITFSPNSQFLIVADNHESGHVWDMSQTPPQPSRLPNLKYTEIVSKGYLKFLPYLNDEGQIFIKDIEMQEESAPFKYMKIKELPETISPDGTVYLTTNFDGDAIVLWAVNTSMVSYTTGLGQASFSPSGRYLAAWNGGEGVVTLAGVPTS